jgi:hypothetical protein
MKLLLTAILTCITLLGVAQVQSNKELILKYSNRVSPTSVIHTVYINEERSNQNDLDKLGQQAIPSGIEGLLARFKSEQGVARATYDEATKTITILTDNSVDMVKFVNELNKED